MRTWGQILAIKSNFGYRKLHVYNTSANCPDTCNDPGKQFIKHRFIYMYVHINSMCKKIIKKGNTLSKIEFFFLDF